MPKTQKALDLVLSDLNTAVRTERDFESPDDGLAFLVEALGCLAISVRLGDPRNTMAIPAAVVASQALRFMRDVCDCDLPD
jgi:hypothetical protein